MHPIRLDTVALGIHLHPRHQIVELHVLLADLAAVPHRLNALPQPVAGHEPRIDAGLADKCHAGRWDHGCKHGSHDHGLHGWDGGVGITLYGNLLVLYFDEDGWRGGLGSFHTICA
jgi:hypothetical protein